MPPPGAFDVAGQTGDSADARRGDPKRPKRRQKPKSVFARYGAGGGRGGAATKTWWLPAIRFLSLLVFECLVVVSI